MGCYTVCNKYLLGHNKMLFLLYQGEQSVAEEVHGFGRVLRLFPEPTHTTPLP
jgi:hypothetical protein